VAAADLAPKGFWRVDRNAEPELRHPVLTLVAFADLDERIRAANGDREVGLETFLSQDESEGWMLPGELRLSDYGLGRDDRAKQSQPVAGRLGPRFYDWQLAQTADESWLECETHAQNLRVTTSQVPERRVTNEAQTGAAPTSVGDRRRPLF